MRRMDRKVIKLETAIGSSRDWLIVKRNHDLIVRNIQEDIMRQFKIPIEELVVFHKGKNLCDYPNETLESLGVENNNLIRITRDQTLPTRSPRSRQGYVETTYGGNFGQPGDYNSYGDNATRLPDINQNGYQAYAHK